MKSEDQPELEKTTCRSTTPTWDPALHQRAGRWRLDLTWGCDNWAERTWDRGVQWALGWGAQSSWKTYYKKRYLLKCLSDEWGNNICWLIMTCRHFCSRREPGVTKEWFLDAPISTVPKKPKTAEYNRGPKLKPLPRPFMELSWKGKVCLTSRSASQPPAALCFFWPSQKAQQGRLAGDKWSFCEFPKVFHGVSPLTCRFGLLLLACMYVL